MLSDAEMDDLRWKADLIGGCVPVRPEELRELLHEIDRLRAELAKSNDARDDDAMTFGNALDRQRAEIDQLSLLLSESREDAARLRGLSDDAKYDLEVEIPEGMRIVSAPPPPLREITCIQCAAVLQYDSRKHIEFDSQGIRRVRCPLCKEPNYHSRGRDVRP